MPILFDNLQDFLSSSNPVRYWSWQNFARNNTRQIMQWHAIKNSPADYLRGHAYSGEADFSVIGKDYAHVSPMGAVEWSWPIQAATSWQIAIDMHFIYLHSQSHKIVELWQDDILLWRRGFSANLPVTDCLILNTNPGSEIRLLVVNETMDIGHSKFVYRLKIHHGDIDKNTVNCERKTQLIMPQKNQMSCGLEKLPPNLQRKFYEKEFATSHLTSEEKTELKQAVIKKSLEKLNLTERKFGESGFFKLI